MKRKVFEENLLNLRFNHKSGGIAVSVTTQIRRNVLINYQKHIDF